jgi:Apea-like HEPN
MLRLFAVASVNYSVYTYSLGDLTPGKAVASRPGDHSVPLVTARVLTKDEPRVRKFWSMLYPILPSHLYKPTNSGTVDYVRVAYERYCAALLRRDIFEERVANAVMGLEALFLEEKQEVSYRCRLRVARAMSYLGENPRDVFGRLADAYRCRNAFAHGDRLSTKNAQKLASRYQDQEILYRSAMNYLRKALVASIVGVDKKATLIAMVDESLVDIGNDKELAAVFAPAASVV